MAQDRLLELADLFRRLDPELVDHRFAQAAMRFERIGLPPALVEREHLLRVEPLPQRIALDEVQQLREHLGGAARGEIGLDAQFERSHPLFLQPGDRGLERLRELEIRERTSTPEPERVAEDAAGTLRIGRQHQPAGLDALGEALAIELTREDPQLVARG